MDLKKQIRMSPYQNMSSDEYRDHLKKETIEYLENEMKFKVFDYLGSGSYGDVISVNSPNYQKAVAVKIVTCDNVWPGEIFLWPQLEHPNLLPLLETIQLPNVYLFITPLMLMDLENVLEEKYFLRNSSALKIVKKWLRDVLAALDYLHERKLCHLDVKADNILLDKNWKVTLCDFSFLSGTYTLVGRYGVPMPYRPPDTCLTFENDIPVDGVQFEMWSYGILAFNMLTGHILKRKLFKETKNWHRDIYPLIFEAMQIHNFYSFMSDAFPSSEIAEEEFENALNFVHFLLRFEPDDRPSARICTGHIFLMRGGFVMTRPDVYWICQDLSDCKCPCLTEVQTPDKQIKKQFPRYKFKKFSPRRKDKIYKKMKKWTKQARGTKTVTLTVVPESGDTGNRLNQIDEDWQVCVRQFEEKDPTPLASNKDENSNNCDIQKVLQISATVDSKPSESVEQSGDTGNSLHKSYEDCQVCVRQLEEKDLRFENNKNENSNDYDIQKVLQVSTAVESSSSEFIEQSEDEVVKRELGDQDEIEENKLGRHFNEVLSAQPEYELSPKKVISTCEATGIKTSIEKQLSSKHNSAKIEERKKYASESSTWIRNLWSSLHICCKKRATRS